VRGGRQWEFPFPLYIFPLWSLYVLFFVVRFLFRVVCCSVLLSCASFLASCFSFLCFFLGFLFSFLCFFLGFLFFFLVPFFLLGRKREFPLRWIYSFSEGLFLLSCSSSASSFLFFCLLLLSCSSVFFFFLVLLSSSSFLFFCLLLLSCCVRARFFRWWDGLADLLQSGLLLRTAGSVSLPESRHVGAQGIILNYRWMLYSYGVSLP